MSGNIESSIEFSEISKIRNQEKALPESELIKPNSRAIVSEIRSKPNTALRERASDNDKRKDKNNPNSV